jgi:hypothetical protein
MVTLEGEMATKNATRGGTFMSTDEGSVQSRGVGPRELFRRQLAGMTYEQQVEALRPPGPVQRQAVQMSEAEERSGEQENPYLARRNPSRATPPLAIEAVIGTDAWRDIQRMWVHGASDREIILALLDSLKEHLVHVGSAAHGERVAEEGGEGWAIATDCHYTCWIIVDALNPLGIDTAFIKAGGHSGLIFTGLSPRLGLFDGDDLIHAYTGHAEVADVERLLLPEAEIVAWARTWEEELPRIRDELEPRLREDEVSDDGARRIEELRALLTEHPLVLLAPTLSGEDFTEVDQVDWVEVGGLEVVSAAPAASLAQEQADVTASRIAGLGGELGDLSKVPNWLLLPPTRNADIQDTLDRVLPERRLPATRSEAVDLAVELLLDQVLREVSARKFFERFTHPSYREEAP